MTKRILCIFLSIISAACMLILSGCSDDNNSEIAGQWTPSTVSIGGTTIAYSELETNGRDFSLTFDTDGKCKILIGGVSNDGTYTFNNTSVDIIYGGKSQKLSYDKGILTLKLDYNNEITSYMFTKVTENN